MFVVVITVQKTENVHHSHYCPEDRVFILVIRVQKTENVHRSHYCPEDRECSL